MDPSGAGEIAAAAKRAKPPWDTATSIAVDRLSALPDEILAEILLSVTSPDAVQTCVLSKRWCSLWKLLPDLHFPFFPKPAGSFRDALDDQQQDLQVRPLHLRDLKVEGHDHGQGDGDLPSSIATWLPAAARRVHGRFTLLVHGDPTRIAPDEDEAADAAVIVELPCFEQATSISIGLSFRGRLAFLPPDVAGVFSRLTDLWLERVQFQDPSALGDAISSARCPCLQTFHVCRGLGLEKLAVSSTSLLKLDLQKLHGLLELTVETPGLKELQVVDCFCTPAGETDQLPAPVISITAPELVALDWRDSITQDAIGFAHGLQHLRSLGTFLFFVYGDEDADSYNRDCVRILQGFRSIVTLTLILAVLDIDDDDEYLMEAITVLPDLTTLHLVIMSSGHCFGNSSLHVLRICTGIRKLVLELSSISESKEPCPFGCICRQQSNWQNKELALVCLQEIEIQGFGPSEHDSGFVEHLFDRATSLSKATIFFDESVTEGMAKELCWMFQLSSKVHIDLRYHNNKKVL
ncbi:hypothetical protein SORBI_3002G015500 [Sorghum bicolor]|uniref:F-box domain-containing protein n=1 Tax=Sorghum bicolor TaxID=4558 RepID=C5X805_SORBI|nr:hypothetical protein SORBI_3002G015500 [Sorghum bicolor]